jgi:hypothetical protein
MSNGLEKFLFEKKKKINLKIFITQAGPRPVSRTDQNQNKNKAEKNIALKSYRPFQAELLTECEY